MHCSELQIMFPNSILDTASSFFGSIKVPLVSCWKGDFIGPIFHQDTAFVDIFTSLLHGTPTRNTYEALVISSVSVCYLYFCPPDITEWYQGSYFTISVTQHWILLQGIWWNFHFPYCPQASGIIKWLTNLIKSLFLKVQGIRWIP